MNDLHIPLRDNDLLLEPLSEAHRAGLARACAADSDIWQIYPVNYGPEAFDTSFSALLANRERLPFAVIVGGRVVGMTAYLRVNPATRSLEIGNSYIAPEQRGTGLNDRMKRLMIEHAFACGFERIEFRIDVRNARSQAAVGKLGARLETVMPAERVTWTGHVRDSTFYLLDRADWARRNEVTGEPAP